MRRAVLALVVGLLIAAPSFADNRFSETLTFPMFVQDVWAVSVRSTLAYAQADFQNGDVIIQTNDPDAPYLKLSPAIIVSCGGPWAAESTAPWIVEIHSTKESADARAAWFPWTSYEAQAPDGDWLLVYRNPDQR